VKRILLGLMVFSLFGILKLSAQQEPMYTQYMFNTLSVNPAYAGTRNALNLNTLTRLQWVGLEGAPKTFSVALHSPINKRKVGLGLTLVTDEVGPVRNTYFTANYAYRLKITDKLTLSMGIKGGISNYYAGLSELKVNDEGDPHFMSDEKKLSPNIGIGFYLYSDKYYVGFSAPKLIETTIDEEYAASKNELKRHYYIIGGYIWQLNSRWLFKPTLLTKAVSGAPVSNDITMQFLYNDRIWMGAMYRIGDAAGLFVDVKINRQIMVGYGYDFSLNGLSGINGGTHEIMLSFDFDGFASSKVKSPRYF
jgi:type IX secretion system PorP/SprF family membrane protein